MRKYTQGGWRGDGGLVHRLQISRRDIKVYGKKWRLIALIRVLWITHVHRHYGEACQVCGRNYTWSSWVAPTWLYEQVKGNRSGLLCPQCFTVMASDKGIDLAWIPAVYSHELIERVFSDGISGAPEPPSAPAPREAFCFACHNPGGFTHTFPWTSSRGTPLAVVSKE
jgi:hypothetical protein